MLQFHSFTGRNCFVEPFKSSDAIFWQPNEINKNKCAFISAYVHLNLFRSERTISFILSKELKANKGKETKGKFDNTTL